MRQLSPDPTGQAPQLNSDQIIDQLGIYALDLSFDWAARHNLLNPRGVVVASKLQTMVAPLTELQVDDVIHKVNTTLVSTSNDLRDVLDKTDPGTAVILLVERDRKTIYMTITIN